MASSIDGFATHRIGIRALLAGAAFASMTFFAGAQAAPDTATTASAIDTIALERNGFGAPTGTVLVLRRDGSATLTRTGSARQGSEDAVERGTVRRKDFDALARLVVARGFFSLDETYQEPDIRDGPWRTVTVSSGAMSKVVFAREDAGPDALKEIEAAIDRARSLIVFTPANR